LPPDYIALVQRYGAGLEGGGLLACAMSIDVEWIGWLTDGEPSEGR